MKVGIYYFSGTGNTAFIAQSFAISVKNLEKVIGENEVSCFDISSNPGFIEELDLLVIGGPIYAGNMPEKLIRWVLRNIPQNNGKTKAMVYSTSAGLQNAYGVDSIASKLSKKGYDLIYKECFEMPRNFYFGGYEQHSEEEIRKRVDEAKKKVEIIAHKLLLNGFDGVAPLEVSHSGILKKDLMAELFSIMAKFMAKNYKADNNCIRCGKCVKNCPQNNIKLRNNEIEFGRNCMMCTKCFHSCPSGAILYKGNKYKQYREFL